mgnify:CR=1 FL=1
MARIVIAAAQEENRAQLSRLLSSSGFSVFTTSATALPSTKVGRSRRPCFEKMGAAIGTMSASSKYMN